MVIARNMLKRIFFLGVTALYSTVFSVDKATRKIFVSQRSLAISIKHMQMYINFLIKYV